MLRTTELIIERLELENYPKNELILIVGDKSNIIKELVNYFVINGKNFLYSKEAKQRDIMECKAEIVLVLNEGKMNDNFLLYPLLEVEEFFEEVTEKTSEEEKEKILEKIKQQEENTKLRLRKEIFDFGYIDNGKRVSCFKNLKKKFHAMIVTHNSFALSEDNFEDFFGGK